MHDPAYRTNGWTTAEVEKALAAGREPLWKNSYESIHEKALANEGQCTQLAYPFKHIRLAKKLCAESNDDPKLFFRYLTLAGKLLRQGFIYKDEEWSF